MTDFISKKVDSVSEDGNLISSSGLHMHTVISTSPLHSGVHMHTHTYTHAHKCTCTNLNRYVSVEKNMDDQGKQVLEEVCDQPI